MTLNALSRRTADLRPTERMPVLFVGHGSPMNAIEDNEYARAWARLAEDIPQPQAVLCVSAHWLTEGAFVHVSERPKTIHDFWGFPKELYDVRYDCPGSPDAARWTAGSVQSATVTEDASWGLDHGAWSVLRRMYPGAHVPCFQLSIDATRHSRDHFAIGKELAALRERGVLIVGSGNVVHNLGLMHFEERAKPFDWAVEFDAHVTEALAKGDHGSLVDHDALGTAARLSVPTPEHWWPLLYAMGAAGTDSPPTFPVTGMSHASVSMRAVLWR